MIATKNKKAKRNRDKKQPKSIVTFTPFNLGTTNNFIPLLLCFLPKHESKRKKFLKISKQEYFFVNFNSNFLMNTA